MEVRLVVVEGKQRGREIPLPPTMFVIGRDRRCHLRPHCELVTGFHCAIAPWAGKVLVRDLKSKNGTFLNGQRIVEPVAVHDGDVLRVGKLVFRFAIQSTPESDQGAEPINPEEVQWLIESPADSVSLSPQRPTRLLPTVSSDARNGEPSASPGEFTGSGAVSAGEYMRDYLRQRRLDGAQQ